MKKYVGVELIQIVQNFLAKIIAEAQEKWQEPLENENNLTEAIEWIVTKSLYKEYSICDQGRE